MARFGVRGVSFLFSGDWGFAFPFYFFPMIVAIVQRQGNPIYFVNTSQKNRRNEATATILLG